MSLPPPTPTPPTTAPLCPSLFDLFFSPPVFLVHPSFILSFILLTDYRPTSLHCLRPLWQNSCTGKDCLWYRLFSVLSHPSQRQLQWENHVPPFSQAQCIIYSLIDSWLDSLTFNAQSVVKVVSGPTASHQLTSWDFRFTVQNTLRSLYSSRGSGGKVCWSWMDWEDRK